MLAPEDNTGRPHVLALEEEAGGAGGQSRSANVLVPEEDDRRPEVFVSEDDWPKVLTLEEEAFAPDVLEDEAGRPEVFTQTKH